MLKKNPIVYFIIILITLFSTGVLYSQAIVKAEFDASEYHIGDIVKIRINLENNPGLHSVYFDLLYNGALFSFEKILSGSVIESAGADGELLYADNGLQSGFSQAKTVVSFSLKGKGIVTEAAGCLAELSFKVIDVSDLPQTFGFSGGKMLDGNKLAISDVQWKDSRSLTVTVPENGAFISIKKPYNNEVIYQDNVNVSLICSIGDYIVKLTNNTIPGFTPKSFTVRDGRLLNIPLNLVEGVNKISADLFMANGKTLLKTTSTRVYRSPSNTYIKITEPANHSLLNTDMVKVRVISPFDDVDINGLSAHYSGENEGNFKVFTAQVWLKTGFNTITAVAERGVPQNVLYENSVSSLLDETKLVDSTANWIPDAYAGKFLEIDGKFATIASNTDTILTFVPGTNELDQDGTGFAYKIRSTKESDEIAGVTFKDTVQVYYQKDSSLFQFVLPLADQGFKSSEYSFLNIKGEIDSPYKTSDDPVTGGPVSNTVTLDVTFIPSNGLLSSKHLVNMQQAVIRESDYSYDFPGARYIFMNDFQIPLKDLSDGEIEISAYKNFNGTTWDDKITRIAYIDNQRLWINLIQPNVYSSDVLDSVVKIMNFNETHPLYDPDDPREDKNVIVTNEGNLQLNTNGAVVGVENISNVTDIAEAPDGTLFALSNPSTSLMKIFMKEPGKTAWTQILSQSGKYGYSLCHTELGLLIGVSNIPSNGNSGLYLLVRNSSGVYSLVNFDFPGQSILHAQFVRYQNGIVYIYGSLFEYLYSFNTRSVTENQGKFSVQVTKTPFVNTANLKGFTLSEGAGTAVLLTDRGADNILFYRKTVNGYSKVTLPELNGGRIISGNNIVYGRYDGSDYNVYLIPASSGALEIVMENTTTSMFYRRVINLSGTNVITSKPITALLGLGFNDSNFCFLFKNAGENEASNQYFMEKGQIFFDQFYRDLSFSNENYTFGADINKSAEKLLFTGGGLTLLGTNPSGYAPGSDNKLYSLYKSVAQTGWCEFNYVNDEAEGITGFSFEVDSRWLALEELKDKIRFGFSARQKLGATTSDSDIKNVILPLGSLSELVDSVKEGSFPYEAFSVQTWYNDTTKRDVVYFEFKDMRVNEYLRFNLELTALAQDNPAISNLTVFKKVRVKMANVPGEFLVLPVQGYVYDRTVSQVEIEHNPVPVSSNGYFSYNYIVQNTQSVISVNIKCRNAIQDEANLDFTIEIVPSKNKLWDVEYATGDSGQLPASLTFNPLVQGSGEEEEEFLINTAKRWLTLRGSFYGLKGAMIGYKLLPNGAENNTEPLGQGTAVITEWIDSDSLASFTGEDLDLSYDAGSFLIPNIELAPNEQKLILYIENPGSLRNEYKSPSDLYPVFNYAMPTDEQNILFNGGVPFSGMVDGIPINTSIEFKAHESAEAPYVFTCEGTVSGQIQSMDQFDELFIYAYTPGLLFGNDQNQVKVTVEAGNRFKIPFKVTMGNAIEANFDIVVIPTITAYNYLRCGLRIRVVKDFTNTAYVPDFDLSHPEHWSEDQKKGMEEVPIRFIFKDRNDVPMLADNSPFLTRGIFTVNFGSPIEGYVAKYEDTDSFCLKNESGVILNFRDIAEGRNRLQWTFEFEDRSTAGEVQISLMSSSLLDGHEDDFFDFNNDVVIAPTIVNVSPSFRDVYYDNASADTLLHTPKISLTKDASTDLDIALNGTVVWTDEAHSTALTDFILPADKIREGTNEIAVISMDCYGNLSKESFRFLYDSKPPVVKALSVKLDDTQSILANLTASVKDANFKRAYLKYGGDIINIDPRVIAQGEDSYLLVWQNLASLKMETETENVVVLAEDYAGHTGESDTAAIPAGGRPDILIWEKQLPKLLPGNGEAFKVFGQSVSISGAYAIVGCINDDWNGENTGSAYIFKKQDNAWNQLQMLHASDGMDHDMFGCAVAISGDYAMVGAKWDDYEIGGSAGTVYVFRRDPLTDTWVEQPVKLVAFDGTGDESFGQSLAIFRDYAIIGAPGDDQEKGSAYIFRLNSTNGVWEPVTAKITADIRTPGDQFGASVSITGGCAIIGAPYSDDSTRGTNSGASFIFAMDYATGTWTLEKKLLALHGLAVDGADGDLFGCSVGISGDYAVVGAIHNDGRCDDSGAAYLFKRSTMSGGWEDQAYKLLTDDSGEPGDCFGGSVSISGDWIVVGAREEGDMSTGDNYTGSAFLYQCDGQDNIFAQFTQKIIPVDGHKNTSFGTAVYVSGDQLIVGAISDYDLGAWSGSVQVFHLANSLNVYEESVNLPIYTDTPQLDNETNRASRPFPEHTKFAPAKLLDKNGIMDSLPSQNNVLLSMPVMQQLAASDPSDGKQYGKSVSIFGDYAFVGAHCDAQKGNGAGAVYIYKINQSNGKWDQLQKLFPDTSIINENFGNAVAVSGDYAIVGASGHDGAGYYDIGCAYIFKLNSSTGLWEQKTMLIPPISTFHNNVYFGYSVAIYHDKANGSVNAIVGMPYDDEKADNSGAVYIFCKDAEMTETWSSGIKYTPSTNLPNNLFGFSVGISENTAIVGAPNYPYGNVVGAGCVFLIKKMEGSVIWEPSLTVEVLPPGEALIQYDNYGQMVAITNNYAIAGVSRDNDNSSLEDSGSAIIFKRNGTVWERKQKIYPDDPSENGGFGYSVSMTDTFAVVGAWNPVSGVTNTGSVYVYKLDIATGDWSQVLKLTPDQSVPDTLFGNQVSIADNHVLVGNYFINGAEKSLPGYAYVYDINRDTKVPYSMLDSLAKRYLVFQIEKDPWFNNITQKADLSGLIKFDVYGLKLNTQSYTVERVAATKTIDLTNHEWYVEGQKYLYYMVDLSGDEGLRYKYLEACDNMFTPLDYVIDKGLLEVTYDLGNLDYPERFKVSDIYVSGESGSVFNDIIPYEEDYQGAAQQGYHDLASQLNHLANVRTKTFQETVPNATIGFWLRLEGENIPDVQSAASPKYVLTLSDNQHDENISLAYRGNRLELFDDTTQYPLPLLDDNPVKDLTLGPDAWCFVALRLDAESGILRLDVYDRGMNAFTARAIELSSSRIAGLLSKEASFYFGPRALDFNTGFYSIAKPFIVNRLYSDFEITRISHIFDGNPGADRLYTFPDYASNFGPNAYDLHIIGLSDHFSQELNADYLDPNTCGSLKASTKHTNYMKTVPDDNGQYVILRDADTCIAQGLTPSGGNGSFTLIHSGNASGIYHFGNKSSNYGLGSERWYSLSGEVMDLSPPATEAYLAMKINGVEQRMRLFKGRFHFVYDNQTSMVPAEVKIYIESNGNITLSNDLILNEGNYVLPTVTGMEKSAASTCYTFNLEGSVDLWYKPFNLNNADTANYPVTIFDSEYIKIGTRIPPGEEEAVYFAQIKSNPEGDSWKTFNSNIKADHTWKHLQVSYDHGNKLAYFYINGKTVDFKEGESLPFFGSLAGEIPQEDNVFLGCDKAASRFAEGYLDEVRISRYYANVLYRDNTPVALKYDAEAKSATIDVFGVNTNDFTDMYYVISAADDSFKSEGTILPVDVSGYPAGRYRVSASLKIKGHKYDDLLYFTIDNRPKFNLVQRTPFVFAGESKTIDFAYVYDHSYRFNSTVLKYTGVATRINFNSPEQTLTRFIVQDFINQDNTHWLTGTVDAANTFSGWNALEPDEAGRLIASFEQISTTTDIQCEYQYFYFTDDFPGTETLLSEVFGDGLESDRKIPLANLLVSEPETVEYETTNGESETYEYMIKASVNGGTGGTQDPIFSEITIAYTATKTDEPSVIFEKEAKLINNGSAGLSAEILYDEMFGEQYGTYQCVFSLKYRNVCYDSVTKTLNWREREIVNIDVSRLLNIKDFSLLMLDNRDDKAHFHIEYEYSDNVGLINYTLEVKEGLNTHYMKNGTLSNLKNEEFFNSIPVPEGNFTVKLIVFTEGLAPDFRELELDNSVDIPTVALTNGVPSEITYNDVFFSWKGYVGGQYLEDIAYQYNFDNRGWSSGSKEWRSVRFYNLEDGDHFFQVKAVYNGMSSNPLGNPFFVDVSKPVFNRDLITVRKLQKANGLAYAVDIDGAEGAVSDISLREISVSTGQEVILGQNGSFSVHGIPLRIDGMNRITLTAVDRVGNFADYVIDVDNTITTVSFPVLSRTVKYSPLTIVGQINSAINDRLSIYIKDPFCAASEDGTFSGWKKAKINEDRTFFVENVFVNPGLRERQIATVLKMVTVSSTGEQFTKDMTVTANEILLPIELSVSTHATEGEGADTDVTISCHANVEGISSWSVDFDGDGVYDEIALTADPSKVEAQSQTWIHRYSSIGAVKPRVRAITIDGNFFSVSDTIIIHEKIKQASNKLIEKPLSISSLRMPDKSNRLYVLRGDEEANLIDVFQIGRNDMYISNKLYSIDLGILGIHGGIKVRALDDTRFVVAANNDGNGILYELEANGYGNYSVIKQQTLSGTVSEVTSDAYNFYVSFSNRNYFTVIPLVSNVLDVQNSTNKVPGMQNTAAIGTNCGIAKDSTGLLVADYQNLRIVRLTNSLSMHEQFGSIGTGENEFLAPKIIRGFENRIFVFDERRQDIQVFDQAFTPVCTLGYDSDAGTANYLDSGFFSRICDIEVVTRVEGNMLYYYALLLSASSEKLALLRLPQWEELRARVRNNKVAFIKEGEVFTAKPDGGDMRRILCSDSLPRIEGALDYPALSPDGRSLVFTSRLALYIGSGEELETTGDIYAYDKIYVYDIENKQVAAISLNDIQGYEIERPVFNSNGDRLIFSAKGPTGTWQLYTYEFITAEIVKVFSSDENARFPYYSPDDRFIAFTSDYDGDEDIVIIDTENLSMRVSVTNNNARDSLPVWVSTYPFETADSNWKIDSKIAYVSDRDYHKGVYYVYLSRKSETDIRVVDSNTGEDIGDDPDSVAIEVVTPGEENDYPCFTGDGMALVFENSNGETLGLKRYDFTAIAPDPKITDMEDFTNASRPAGMKNMITKFMAVNKNGDEIELSWNRYTDNDIFYTVQFKPNNADDPFAEKKVFSQTGTALKGLKMGQEYIVRVCIVENAEVVATSQWIKVTIPVIVAKPTYEVDAVNPYLVHLHAWKPEDIQGNDWRFSWIIDNNEVNVQEAQDYAYEYGTSGRKTILLKAYTGTNYDHVNFSAPFTVDIRSDIEPFIDPVLAEDSSYIELSCVKSTGSKINFSTATWSITGTNASMPQLTLNGPTVIAPLTGFTRKINVALTLQRMPVNGQQATDTIVKTRIIDLDLKELKPVITCVPDEVNNRLIKFSGQDSIGNIDWYRAKWVLYADGGILQQVEGVSGFDYLFPERNANTVYTVSLTIPRKNDGMTQTISQVVTVEASPIRPDIDYTILDMTQGGNVIGRKILFDCTKSLGSEIDFSLARWSVPIASNYGEQSVQQGPTATYNLAGIADRTVIEVTLTLCRRGGTDAITKTELIEVKEDGATDCRLVVNRSYEGDSTTGRVLVLDVYRSTGPNIDWINTEWLIDNQYTRKGASVRIDIPASADGTIVTYTCTLYRFGGQPQTKTDTIKIGGMDIKPFINAEQLSPTAPNAFRLDVLGSSGVNIDWDRTRWYIHDGSQNVVVKEGAVITYAFAIAEEKMGYPVIVEMFMKGDSKPFVAYKPIDVAGNELIPVIMMDTSQDDPNMMVFSADASVGANIDWLNTKWTFMDTGESQYGPYATHTFPASLNSRKYMVMLTLFRKLSNGEVETKTLQKEISVDSAEITPVVKAKVFDGTLVLSAEESRGKGLLLDRALWVFPGQGDSTTFTDNTQYGTINKDTWTFSANTGVEWTFDVPIGDLTIKAGVGVSFNHETTNYDSYRNVTNALTTLNEHTGVICRRYVGSASSQIVTLLVYRMTRDGGVEGKSITVNIDLKKAAAMAGTDGVTYE